MYAVKLGKQAIRDLDKLKAVGLSEKAKRLVDLLKLDTYQNPPSYEKLVAIHRMWTHYE